MEIRQLRCIVAVADEMHFGRAAMRLEMLPAALGRTVRQLEDGLGIEIFQRTTRAVTVTPEGRKLIKEARSLLTDLDAAEHRWRKLGRRAGQVLRLGAIDTAASGMVPGLLQAVHAALPDLKIQLVEDRSIKLIPRLLAGSLDLALVRPGLKPFHRRLTGHFLLSETSVVVLPEGHALAERGELTIQDLRDVPLIVPDRRSRPHSHDLVFSLFERAGLEPRIVQNADEKQTMMNMVAAGIGAAIVPRWWSGLVPRGVRIVQLETPQNAPSLRLPLHVVWPRDVRDPSRDAVVALLMSVCDDFAVGA
ncbi:LysR family transcriptional regulator [Paracoccus laeviglucosivorans]|uniref:DNA-binding transcriptional regulator, LysR family n=1 Tax=Paracoccus laeviglucosivorans TaxID=1197861 RepID=A0A521FF32_9RHOB|nr:LysR family transcriptional regulator [Paracoccus laeviglucosivorans]SMO94705.1 DNA-binding transcriptional regulator, LysR family [Paracoccus laeviglucosivorans]